MINQQELFHYAITTLIFIVIIVGALVPLALSSSLEPDVYDLWTTLDEFERVSSLRNFLVDKDFAYGGVSINELDYILVLVQQCSNEFFPNVPTSLVLSVISIESGFRKNLYGLNDDIGLMQIIEKFHRERIQKYLYDENVDLYDLRLNVMVGMDYLNELLDEFDNDIPTALTAYNMGPDKANRMRSEGRVSLYAQDVIERMEAIDLFFERG